MKKASDHGGAAGYPPPTHTPTAPPHGGWAGYPPHPPSPHEVGGQGGGSQMGVSPGINNLKDS